MVEEIPIPAAVPTPQKQLTVDQVIELGRAEMQKIQSKSTTIQNNMYENIARELVATVTQLMKTQDELKKEKNQTQTLKTQLQVGQVEIKKLKEQSKKAPDQEPSKK